MTNQTKPCVYELNLNFKAEGILEYITNLQEILDSCLIRDEEGRGLVELCAIGVIDAQEAIVIWNDISVRINKSIDQLKSNIIDKKPKLYHTYLLNRINSLGDDELYNQTDEIFKQEMDELTKFKERLNDRLKSTDKHASEKIHSINTAMYILERYTDFLNINYELASNIVEDMKVINNALNY